MSDLAHVHLGPGKVGLGSVVATTRKAGMEVHLVARPGCPLDRERLSVVRYGDHGQAYPAESLDVATLSCPTRCDELDRDALTAVETAPALLITTSLGCRGLRDRAELIRDLVALRPPALRDETVVLPVEVDLGRSWPGLDEDLRERGVECRGSMVDGLFREGGARSDPAVREIHAEADVEWLIEGEADKLVLRALSGVGGVRMVDDVDPYRRRRRWLVDSGMLATAIAAREQRRPDARFKDADLERLSDFYAPAVRAFDRRAREDLDARAYADDHLQMSIRHGYDAEVALDSLRRADPLPFLKQVDRALAEPLAAVTADGDAWPGATEAMDALHRILVDEDLYSDFEDVAARRVAVTKEVDDAAADLYGTIAGRVYSGPEAVKKKRELSRRFQDHREELGDT